MASRMQKLIQDVKVNVALATLTKAPRLALAGVKSLKLTCAHQNPEAQNFIDNFLTRVSYANPHIKMNVDRWHQNPYHKWKPTMRVEFMNGRVQEIDMIAKTPSDITIELMDAAGGGHWKTWKERCRVKGMACIEDWNREPIHIPGAHKLPTLEQYRETREGALIYPMEESRKKRRDTRLSERLRLQMQTRSQPVSQ